MSNPAVKTGRISLLKSSLRRSAACTVSWRKRKGSITYGFILRAYFKTCAGGREISRTTRPILIQSSLISRPSAIYPNRVLTMKPLGSALVFYLKYPDEMYHLYEKPEYEDEEPDLTGLADADRVREMAHGVGEAAYGEAADF